MKKITVLFLIIFLTGTHLFADKSKQSEDTRLAVKLLKVTNTDENIKEATQKMLDAQSAQNPMFKEYRHVLEKFYDKYLNWDAIKNDIAQIYVEAFTTEELKGLIKFYKTSLGKKVAEKLPELTQKGYRMSLENVQKHQGELMEMLQKEREKKEKQQKSKPAK
ncbi:MAG: DUF2059 domain-containing protein [bacterium]